MIMKFRSLVLLSVLFLTALAASQTRNQAYLLYIDQYHSIAEKQQKEHGIPASIILAQGLLESGAGQSRLSLASNNHFGIKCTDWLGAKVYYDDDAKGECFRKYNKVLESYEDHSAFLRTRNRYAFLFELNNSDYEGWAFGLKKAGYATDPTYPFKLISLIETYNLHQFDLGQHQIVNMDNNLKITKSERKSTAKAGKDNYTGSMGSVQAYNIHEVMSVNGVHFVTAGTDDSYQIIADEFNMSEKRLRRYNDVDQDAYLSPGTRVFTAAKKNKAPKECLTHQVLAGESMYSIAQDYGIKIMKLYELNQMSYDEGAKYASVLKLR